MSDSGSTPAAGEGERGAADAARRKLRAFWNERYDGEAFAYGTAPNEFLVQVLGGVRDRGRVLCLADGEGRNGVWLAQQGWQVTSVDIADRGLEKARSLARAAGVTIDIVAADVTRFDLGRARWDAIVSIFLHLPPQARRNLHARAIAALRPGAPFVYEAYSLEQLGRGTGGPKEAALLPTLHDVLDDLDGLQVEHRFAGLRDVREGWLHSGVGHVLQITARRPVS